MSLRTRHLNEALCPNADLSTRRSKKLVSIPRCNERQRDEEPTVPEGVVPQPPQSTGVFLPGSLDIKVVKKTPAIDKAWALAAWEALEQAFIRYPSQIESLAAMRNAKEVFVDLYTKRSQVGTAIKWFKYHCAYAFAAGLEQDERPVAPSDEQDREADGCFCKEKQLTKCMLHAMKRAGSHKCYARFLLDILFAKTGTPPAKDDFVKGAVVDHMTAMTKTKSAEELALLEEPLTLVEAEIRKEVKRLFHGKSFEHTDPFPSGSAAFRNPSSEGGAFVELMDGFYTPFSDKRGRMFDNEGKVDDEHLVACFQDYVDDLWLGRLDQRLPVTPVALLEPLKVRIITKGEAAEYYRVVELQKFMHGILRRHPVFQYTGCPIDDKSFSACFGSQEQLQDDEFYVSGDYKAATDNLNPRLSEFAWQEIARETTIVWQGVETSLLQTPYYQLGKKALTGHQVHYISKRMGLDSIVDQTWGQLMGSPMSFPILCLVNSAATHVALDLTLTKKSKIRVNGDDIAFIANPTKYETWKRVTAACGLEFSIGKNYCSRKFIIINSEFRWAPKNSNGIFYIADKEETSDLLDMRGPILEDPAIISYDPGLVTESSYVKIEWFHERLWKLEGFYNQSIARNIVRKGIGAGKSKDVYWTDFEALAHGLLKGVNKLHQGRFLNEFLKNNSTQIAEMPSGCNLFFPRCLGGAGVPIPAGSTIDEMVTSHTKNHEIIVHEQKKAAYLATHGKRRLELPHIALTDTGCMAKCLKHVRKVAPGRTPVLRTDRKLDLGLNPTQLLSRVIEAFDTHPEWTSLPLSDIPDGHQLHQPRPINIHFKDNVLFGEPAVAPLVHAKRLAKLNHQYRQFGTGRFDNLEPMHLDNIIQFEETLMFDTLWPITGCKTSIRDMDTSGVTLEYMNTLGLSHPSPSMELDS